MSELKIKNDADELTIAEQKTILSADAYFITCENLLFSCLILKYKHALIVWTPADIDSAIVYLKKNKIEQTLKL